MVNPTFGPQTLSVFRELGQPLKKTTGEQRSYQFLIQRVSVAIQTVIATSVLGTLDQFSRTSEDPFFFNDLFTIFIYLFIYLFLSLWLLSCLAIIIISYIIIVIALMFYYI